MQTEIAIRDVACRPLTTFSCEVLRHQFKFVIFKQLFEINQSAVCFQNVPINSVLQLTIRLFSPNERLTRFRTVVTKEFVIIKTEHLEL